MKPLRVKILGSGNAAKKHARAFAALPELYQLTDSDDHDIVDICTVNIHHEMCVNHALLETLSHVIVEKPICGSLLCCDLFRQSEEASGKRIFPIFQYRFADHDPVGNQIITRWKRDASYYEGWRGDWNQALGGCLTSHGIHAIDLMIQAHGMPLIVTAGMNTTPGPETFADIFMGEPGSMVRVATFIHPDIEQGGFNLGDSHKGYVEQFRAVHAEIVGEGLLNVGKAPTLAEARQSLEVLTAAYWSAYTGEPATLPILPEHPFYQGWSKYFAQPSLRIPASRRTHE